MTKINHESRKRKDRARGNSAAVAPERMSKRQKVVAARSEKRFEKIRKRIRRPGLLQVEAESFDASSLPGTELIKKGE